MNKEVIEQAEIETKYSGYLVKEKASTEKLIKLENIKIPQNLEV